MPLFGKNKKAVQRSQQQADNSANKEEVYGGLTVSSLLKKVRELEIKSKRLTNHLFTGEYHTAFKGRGMSLKKCGNTSRAMIYGLLNGTFRRGWGILTASCLKRKEN
jgi:hypothetical protein